MKKFQPFETNAINGGEQKVYRFDNGFGASVVRHNFSYGHEAGLWELAVIKFAGKGWDIAYDTEITDDVIGRLSDAEVDEHLSLIEALAQSYEHAH